MSFGVISAIVLLLWAGAAVMFIAAIKAAKSWLPPVLCPVEAKMEQAA